MIVNSGKDSFERSVFNESDVCCKYDERYGSYYPI